MIVDKISKLGNYKLPESVEGKILGFIDRANSEELELGRYDLDGENLFALVQCYVGKQHSEGKWETHEKYVDLQYIQSGSEIIKVIDCEDLTLEKEYDNETDIAFYKDHKESTLSILEKGMFGIYLPHEGHMPGLKVNDEEIKKIVFKIKSELIK